MTRSPVWSRRPAASIIPAAVTAPALVIVSAVIFSRITLTRPARYIPAPIVEAAPMANQRTRVNMRLRLAPSDPLRLSLRTLGS